MCLQISGQQSKHDISPQVEEETGVGGCAVLSPKSLGEKKDSYAKKGGEAIIQRDEARDSWG